MEGPKSELEILEPPSDGISSIHYGADPDHFLVSSWDSSLSLYSADSGARVAWHTQNAPVLDSCFAGSRELAIGGGLSRMVFSWNVETNTVEGIGEHENSVRCVRFLDSVGLIVTGSWDKTMRTWDLRAASRNLSITYLQERVHALGISQKRGYIVLGTANKEMLIYDFRNLQEPLLRKDSPLKYQTRCVDCMPSGDGYALGSIEGRVGLEYFDNYQARKYAFKCHRNDTDGTTMIYMVNSIAFHPSFGTFATGGSDGMVYVWDGVNKKRIWKLRQYPTSIAALSFSPSGRHLVIGCSYLYEDGMADNVPKDCIFVRAVEEADVQPKAKT